MSSMALVCSATILVGNQASAGHPTLGSPGPV